MSPIFQAMVACMVITHPAGRSRGASAKCFVIRADDAVARGDFQAESRNLLIGVRVAERYGGQRLSRLCWVLRRAVGLADVVPRQNRPADSARFSLDSRPGYRRWCWHRARTSRRTRRRNGRHACLLMLTPLVVYKRHGQRENHIVFTEQPMYNGAQPIPNRR